MTRDKVTTQRRYARACGINADAPYVLASLGDVQRWVLAGEPATWTPAVPPAALEAADTPDALQELRRISDETRQASR